MRHYLYRRPRVRRAHPPVLPQEAVTLDGPLETWVHQILSPSLRRQPDQRQADRDGVDGDRGKPPRVVLSNRKPRQKRGPDD